VNEIVVFFKKLTEIDGVVAAVISGVFTFLLPSIHIIKIFH